MCLRRRLLRLADGDLLWPRVRLGQPAQCFVYLGLGAGDLSLRALRIRSLSKFSRARFANLRVCGHNPFARGIDLCISHARRGDRFVQTLPRDFILVVENLITLYVRVGTHAFGNRRSLLRASLLHICFRGVDGGARLIRATALSGRARARA